ncbi:hypothetical protein [uncultured Arcticibacterium sp.]|uniref:hypothetical protein n=1 Tax=uncultured Arcticibacterium sp. TaxID=2173042 RepID=UPI0030F78AFE
MEKLFSEISRRNVHYGNNVAQIRNMFSRKQESLTTRNDKFFSKYWQVYAWAAVIGLINDKREVDTDLPHQSSFQYQMIINGSESIAHALLLMAIGKIEAEKSEDFLNSRKLLTIISEYAEGGAKYILEIRQTSGYERLYDSPDDYLLEIMKR